MSKQAAILSVLIFSLLISAIPAAAEDGYALQTNELTLNSWGYHYSRHTFSVTDRGFATLTVTKTTPDKLIRRGFLFMNRRAIPLKKFLRSDRIVFQRKIKLRKSNRLNVFLLGKPGAGIKIDIQLNNEQTPPPVITFEADPPTITLGESSLLKWQTQNADSAAMDNDISIEDINGTVEVIPVDTTTYTLTATGPGGTTSAQVTVTVNPLPPTVVLTSNPETIVAGQSALLEWSSDFAQSCVIEPDIGVVALTGSMAVTPSQTTTYKIVATGEGGEAADEITVTVTDPLPTVEITSADATIILGETTSLNWTSTHADTVTIEPGIGTVAPEGSVSISPTETTTYTITATGTGGTNTDQVTVAVAHPVPVITFSASPSTMLLGQSATLSWTSIHAETVEIDQNIGEVDASGSHEVSPSTTTVYTLTATGQGGTVTGEEMVTVTYPQPTVDLQISQDSITAGQSATLSWTSANAVSVSLDNGIGTVVESGSLTISPTSTTTYTITAIALGGATVTDSVTLTVNTPAPVVTFTAEPDTIIEGATSNLTWNTTHADTVTIDPDIGGVGTSGSTSVSPAATAIYTITAIGAGGTTSTTVTVTVIAQPTVSISADPGTINNGQSTVLSWLSANADTCVIEPDIGTVSNNGSIEVSPVESTIYTITATGPGGSTAANTQVTVIDPNAVPTVQLDSTDITIAQGESVTLNWSSSGAQSAHMDNGVGIVPISGSRTVTPENTTTYTLTVTGATGSASVRAVIYVTGDPDPQPKGTFGHTYNDLIPVDATVTDYEESRFALVVGEVRNVAAEPIEGVSVTIHNRPEYGTALTDAQGRFSLPVEGGDWMTVVYKKQDLITSHRKVNVPWNNFVEADTVTMIGQDALATTVTFDGNTDSIITHQSTPVTDDAGTRSTTLVFTGDNRAYLVDENGNDAQELTTITTRATEYHTPESMPAALPPTSAYTYCAELTVDGAQRVRFEKPVVMWVDNFIGFDVGEIVPVGSYNRDRGVWIAEENGVVVKLLDTDSDGIVDALDADGDDQPDDLDQDGSFADEVQGLDDPVKYIAGNSYWRSEVSHFTPWDCNWPYGPPQDSSKPNPDDDLEIDDQCEEDCEGAANSYVEQRGRIYHEDIAIPGTDMTLHYASNRTKGYLKKISIPASGASVPASLRRIVVKMQVAGRTLYQVLDPLPNQVAHLTWDGLDRYGNPVGMVRTTVKIGFVYRLVYYSSLSQWRRSFGNVGGSPFSLGRGRTTMTIWKTQPLTIKGFKIKNAPIAEGWTLSPHHQVQQGAALLHKGDGSLVDDNSKIITTAAGGSALQLGLDTPQDITVDASGNLYIADYLNSLIRKVDTNGVTTTVTGDGSRGFGGDGGPADQAQINLPRGVVADAFGNLYIADTYNDRIRKVDTNGIITTVAGTGNGGFSGDDGPAVQAQIDYPTGVALDASGNLYFSDTSNYRIRKVDTNGIITTVAGTGIRGFSGDGGPALDAQLSYVYGLVVDNTGNLYFASAGNNRIRKVDTTGIITTVAGNGLRGFEGDDGPAELARLDIPHGVTMDASGNLYIVDSGNDLVRKVDTNGIITTLAGNGSKGFSGDGGPPALARLNGPNNASVDASGHLYIADGYNDRIRKIAPVSEAFSKVMTDGLPFVTEKNGLGHVISEIGLHKSTIDLDTGVAFYEFGYDQEDRLVSITDQFGNSVTIERDADGTATAINSPDNIRTELRVDTDNYLEQVIYPDGSVYDFTYTPDGLMTTEVDPNSNRFEHIFDSIGRLTDVSDPEGGNWHYAKSTSRSGEVRTEVTSAEGNTLLYLDRTYSGIYTSTIIDENGDQSTYTRSVDNLSANKVLPCGTTLNFEYGLDPEFLYKSISSSTETMPSGLEKNTTKNRSYDDTDADEIMDRVTTTISRNNKTTTFVNNTLSSEVTITSPEGRIVTSTYDPATLRKSSLSVPGLFDTEYLYDSRGRITTVKADTREITFTYNRQGLVDSITNPQNLMTTYSHDAVGRITGISRPDGSSIGFRYDPNGNITFLTNPVDVDHAFSFNRADIPSGYQTPISGRYRYLYDADRRLITIDFPSGKLINNIYTAARLTQIQTPEGNIDLTYGCSSKIASVYKAGEIIEYAYDGKLLTDVSISGTLNQSINNTYNEDFNITAITYAGSTSAYGYDLDGLLAVAGDFTITRNAQNGLPESVIGNGLSISRTFNGHAELDEQAVSVSSQPVIQWALSRDDAGRITTKTETASGESHNYEYGYDAMGRLITVTRDGTLVEAYGYDLAGTRTSETNTLRGITSRTLSYSDEDHLLTAGGVTYTYDLDGFLTTKTDGANITTFSYSSRGELQQVDLPDGRVVTYLHDPTGRRIAKRIDGTIVEKYLWRGLTTLLAVYDGSDNLVQRFEYADGRIPLAVTQGGSTYYLAYDQVGTLRIVSDTSGNVVKRIDYDSFGNILSDTNGSFTIPFGFAGGLHDRDIGLVRFGYRDYDPDTGRWTAKDPIGFAGGDTDLYGYVQNNPVNWIDPLGLAIVNNNTGSAVVVSGNIGSGHGTGSQAFGVIPPGATGGGADNPIDGFATRGEAIDAANPDFVGPHNPLGKITDVDYYDNPCGEHSSNKQADNKLIGDEKGPTYDLNLEDGKIVQDAHNLTVPGAYLRRIAEKIGSIF